jgi:hypothetical protein
MAAPIQSPAKREVRSVIRFLSAKGEHPAEIHKQTVVVYGDVMNQQNVMKWCREFSKGKTDVHDEQRSGRSSLSLMTFFRKLKEKFVQIGVGQYKSLITSFPKCLRPQFMKL